MTDKDNRYELYLSSRISVLERVVEKLAANHIKSADNPAKALADLRTAVLADMHVAPGNTGGVNLTPSQQEWLRRENAMSKEAAEKLFFKLESVSQSGGDR